MPTKSNSNYVTKELFDERTKWMLEEIGVKLDAMCAKMDRLQARVEPAAELIRKEMFGKDGVIPSLKERIDKHEGWLSAIKIISCVVLPLMGWLAQSYLHHTSIDSQKFEKMGVSEDGKSGPASLTK